MVGAVEQVVFVFAHLGQAIGKSGIDMDVAGRARAATAAQCQQFELPFSLCGELAADPEGAILLVAMGYRSLSMNPSSINQVKWALRRLEVRYMEDLLAECLRQPSAILVQRLVRNFIVENGLSQLLYTCHGISDPI